MRGIQINNYFNNHITLNGKKVNQDPQTIPPQNKQKALNPNVHVVDHQKPQQLQEMKSVASKSQQLAVKKKTTMPAQIKKQASSKRSLSTQRQRIVTSAKKKEETIDYELGKQDNIIDMSQKKLKSHVTKGGLGKRSKSTIIKTGHIDLHKDTIKKELKKLTSNPTDESLKPKMKRKKSSRTIEHSKQLKYHSKPLSSRRQFIPMSSKETSKKEKISLKFNRFEEKEDKKSLSNIKGKSNTKRKSSKPASARDKKIKKDRFIEELKEKYENQAILQGDLSHRIRNHEDMSDNDFMSVVNSLEKVLNSVGSRQQLKKEIFIIQEKLKEFRLHSNSDKSQIFEPEEYRNIDDESSNRRQSEQQKNKEACENEEEFQEFEKKQHDIGKYQEDSEEETPLKHKIQDEPNHEADEEKETTQRPFEFVNPLVGKRNGFLSFQTEKSEIEDQSQVQKKRQIQLLKQFKNQSTKMMQKAGIPSIDVKIEKEEPQKEDSQSQRQYKPARRQLFICNQSNISNNSSNSHMKEDKYPPLNPRSPKFDQIQLVNIISMKQKFLESKHDKMSELVTKMFQKQLVSPRSYEVQLKSLNKRYQNQNMVLESLRKQAEQMSSMLSEINKDKLEIQGIDDLIRNQKWDQARKLVQNNKIQEQPQEQEDQKEERPQSSHNGYSRQKQEITMNNWQKQDGWQRVQIKQSDVENNQFVDIEQMNRLRSNARHQVDLDIDQQCGGTEQSIEIQELAQPKEEDCIYYNEDHQSQQKEEELGLFKLVPVKDEGKEPPLYVPPQLPSNDKVFHIEVEDNRSQSFDASIIDKNQSNASATSQVDRKGFVTNLYFIKEYCIALCEFVRDKQLFKEQFKVNVSKPLQYNLPQLLKYLRQDNLDPYLYTKRTNKLAINERVWNDFNAQYQSLKCNANQGKTDDRFIFEKEQELIFLRMIYQVLNESLDYQRPGSQFGKAFPWNSNAKHLKNMKQLSQPDKDNIEAYDLMFGVAIARIIQWGSCLCGFLPDTVQLQNTQIDEPYVNHIRQTRMAFLLEKTMAAQQLIMVNFELQETEVQYRLSSMIISELLDEAVSDIYQTFS